jgi:hypothetical protein
MDKTAIQAGPPLATPAETGIQTGVSANGAAHANGAAKPSPRPSKGPVFQILEALADLRITVALFVLSLVLVFYGTLVQKDIGTWPAVNQYFRTFFVKLPVETVLLYVNSSHKLLDPESKEAMFSIPGWIPYPGGWLLGALMLVNLLAAHAIRFKLAWRRSGILLIHAGIIILMLGELITGLYAVEGIMTIEEGKSSNFIEHRDTPELAFVRPASADKDEVIAFRKPVLKPGEILDHPALPFTIQVKEFMINSEIKDIEKGGGKATAGLGLQMEAVPVGEARGMEDDQNLSSAYVTLMDRANGKELGTYLVSARLNEQWIRVGDQTYQMSLRFKRSPRPYTFHLEKFEFKKFLATGIARDFRSHIHLVDPTRGEDRKGVEISMNNPLRYHGETFYQFQANPGGMAGTVLQVVRNPAWTLPYIACTVVCLGMLIHFGLHLSRFLERRAAS